MKEEVIIYALIDPIKLKVRYIGRTRSSLKKRLAEHMTKAKYNYCKTHKGNWIRSLIRMNSKPFIKELTRIDGWKESHEFERKLIAKYKDRLLNHDDRGEGGVNRVYTDEQRDSIRKTLKEYYSKHQIKTCTEIHVYNYDGTFYKSYPSIKSASKDTGVYHGTISKHLAGVSKVPNRIKMQFSYEKVESMRNWEIAESQPS